MTPELMIPKVVHFPTITPNIPVLILKMIPGHLVTCVYVCVCVIRVWMSISVVYVKVLKEELKFVDFSHKDQSNNLYF